MDNLEYWREVLLDCLEADLDFSMKLERHQISKFAGLFLGCFSPNSQTIPTSEIEAEVLRFIFHVIHRASFEAPNVSFSPTAAFLIDFAKVYATSNPETVKEVFSKFLSINPGLESDFICARASMVDYLKSIVKKLEKIGHRKIDPSYRTFVVGLFANIGLALSSVFSASSQVCSWFNQTSDFLASCMIFYDSVTQLIILEPISFDGSVKQKFVFAIHLSLDTRYFSPIKNFGTSPSTRVSLFDQMYAILSKQFSPEEECQPKKALFDAPLVADLSLTYDYPTLLLSLDCVDIA
ncbi:hypothetical protein DSO57_1010815 [Entomophthora muscae]|uniref:Uncharacterized protein n=1 Tax=Entomophthora muscae TaxID=34485 RepID=A0ACC2RLI6_9FUNG|nr:hypothetical protein DSO57_1010815 [Entomophthora muscae]